jgi:hypothetical protein
VWRVGRAVVFTQAVIGQIAPWVRNGAGAVEIAQRIGCTVGTLRVRCSQLGVSLKRPKSRSAPCAQAVRAPPRRTRTEPAAVSFEVTLSQPCLAQFEGSARARGLSSAALAQALLEVIVQDGLCEAVLDEGPPRAVTDLVFPDRRVGRS